MHFLALYSGWIVVGSVVILVISAIVIGIYNDMGVVDSKSLSVFLVLIVLSFFSAVGFSIWFWNLADDYNVLVSSQSVDVLKVDNFVANNADVTYLANGVLKEANYSGSIKVSSTIKKPTMDIEVQKNIFGDRQTVSTDLVVPEDYIK